MNRKLIGMTATRTSDPVHARDVRSSKCLIGGMVLLVLLW
jgi:hypothetical protein